jgi:hypothetical protein
VAIEKTITLTSPFPGHGGTATTVKLREPKARDYLELGEPRSVMQSPDGAAVFVDNDLMIKAYVERCIVEPDPLLVVNNTSLADMIAIREAVLGFFTTARSTLAGAKPKSDSTS